MPSCIAYWNCPHNLLFPFSGIQLSPPATCTSSLYLMTSVPYIIIPGGTENSHCSQSKEGAKQQKWQPTDVIILVCTLPN